MPAPKLAPDSTDIITDEIETENPHRSIMERIGKGIHGVHEKITRAMEHQMDIDHAYNIHRGRDSLANYEYPLHLWRALKTAKKMEEIAEAGLERVLLGRSFLDGGMSRYHDHDPLWDAPPDPRERAASEAKLSRATKHFERIQRKIQRSGERVSDIEDILKSRAWESNWRYKLDPTFHMEHYMELHQVS